MKTKISGTKGHQVHTPDLWALFHIWRENDETIRGRKSSGFNHVSGGSYTVRVLGEWGADCIKIESHKGDPARTQGAVFNMPFTDDENLAFDVANLNKKFITLNLKTEKGLEICYKLLEEADVFVTNTRTKSLVKLGLDYDTLKEKFPKLIFAQVLGYGEKGPEKDTAGFDVTCYMARGGVFGTTVNRGDAPMIPTNGFGDFQVAMSLASGICAACTAGRKPARETRLPSDCITRLSMR